MFDLWRLAWRPAISEDHESILDNNDMTQLNSEKMNTSLAKVKCVIRGLEQNLWDNNPSLTLVLRRLDIQYHNKKKVMQPFGSAISNLYYLRRKYNLWHWKGYE